MKKNVVYVNYLPKFFLSRETISLCKWKKDTDAANCRIYKENVGINGRACPACGYRKCHMGSVQEIRHTTSYTSSTQTHFMQQVTQKTESIEGTDVSGGHN